MANFPTMQKRFSIGILILFIVLLCFLISGWRIYSLYRQRANEHAFIRAIYAHEAQTVRRMLQQGMNPEAKEVFPETLPYEKQAIKDILLTLIGKKPPGDESVEKLSALQIALYQEDYPIVRLLAYAGANPHTKIPQWDRDYTTPLALAIYHRDFKLVEFLVSKGVDLNQGNDQFLPITIASRSGSVEMVDLLLKHGAKINGVTDRGYCALTEAAFAGDLQMVKYLLRKGAKVNVNEGYGYTPLAAAIEGKNPSIVKLFIEHGGNVNDIDAYGASMLIGAKVTKNKQIIDLLIKAGAKHNPRND